MKPGPTWQQLRVAWYRRRWTCASVVGHPELRAPAVLAGAGTIRFEGTVTLGWEQGPWYLSGYSYLEARNAGAELSLGHGTHLNNGVTLVSEGAGIAIGARCLIGPGVHVYDSDFHPLSVHERATSSPAMATVTIGDDVFIGTAAIVLKGVTIGDGGVVGAGAVVAGDVPAGATVFGNPARTRA